MSILLLDKAGDMQIEKLMDSLPDLYTIADRELIHRAYRMAEVHIRARTVLLESRM